MLLGVSVPTLHGLWSRSDPDIQQLQSPCPVGARGVPVWVVPAGARRHHPAIPVQPLGSYLPLDVPSVLHHTAAVWDRSGVAEGSGAIPPASCHPQGAMLSDISGLEAKEAFEQFLVGDIARSSSQSL